MKEDVVLFNFVCQGIVDDVVVVEVLWVGKLCGFVIDFFSLVLIGVFGVLVLFYLGVSIGEFEENCVVMVVDVFIDFLENGNICYLVNFFDLILELGSGVCLVVINCNIFKMFGQVLLVLVDVDINVIDMFNKSCDELVYNLLDLEEEFIEVVMVRICVLEGVVNVCLVCL